MPLGLINQQWLNANSQRAYPLSDWGARLDKTATIKIPDSLILEMSVPVHAGLNVEPDKFFIKGLGIYPTGYNIVVGYDDGTDAPPTVAAVNIAKSAHEEFRSYALPGSGDFDDTVGKIVIGSLDDVDVLPPGQYVFDPASTPIESDAIWPLLRGISSITLVNGSDRSEKIYGDTEFVAHENMRISLVEIDGQPSQIHFSAIKGEGLNEECVCDDENLGDGIKFINGIPPLPNGNFRMVGDKCIDLEPITNGLKLNDGCSSPCCGCAELAALVRQIDRFADGAATLQSFAAALRAEVSGMFGVVLGSRLGDNACASC